MKAGLHAWVRRWWRGEAGVRGKLASIVAAPFTTLYRTGVAARNRRYDRKGTFEVPGLAVVSVGNLTVGGTGKTPFAAWVVRLVKESGTRVVLLARGYGQDELELHRQWNPSVPVVAGADRVPLALEAARRGAKVAVLDDGFQHRRLARALDIVLVAAEDPFPGRLLPRGPFREPIQALDRAHAVVVTRRTAPADQAARLARRIHILWPHLRVGVLALVPGAWRDLSGGSVAPPQGPTMVAAGVARPEAFATQVERETGRTTQLTPFPDHHVYGEGDVRGLRARAGGRTLVVTEKDAVKLRAYESLLGPVRVLTQTLRWEEGEDAVRALILAAAREVR